MLMILYLKRWLMVIYVIKNDKSSQAKRLFLIPMCFFLDMRVMEETFFPSIMLMKC